MARWLDRANRLTYDGETITESVDVGAGGVVVTTHRVLVFRPEDDGEMYTAVDLPNVTGVEREEAGERRFLALGAQAGLLGTVLLLAGALLPVDSLVGEVSLGEGAGRLGVGGVVGLVESLVGILRSLDAILLVLGALAYVVAAGALGWYLRTRERRLQVTRAGDDPLTLSVGEESLPDGTVVRLRRALRPDE